MEFPITELLDYERSVKWLIEHFHLNGLRCPECEAPVETALEFRQTKCSQLTVYRCRCGTAYNLYTGTVFQQRHLNPRQAMMFIRGVCKGEPTRILAAELGLDYKMALQLRHDLQANAERLQADTALTDPQTETDEMFQNAGEKR